MNSVQLNDSQLSYYGTFCPKFPVVHKNEILINNFLTINENFKQLIALTHINLNYLPIENAKCQQNKNEINQLRNEKSFSYLDADFDLE